MLNKNKSKLNMNDKKYVLQTLLVNKPYFFFLEFPESFGMSEPTCCV